MTEREFELTIFGATGFTGAYVLRNAVLWQDIENRKRKIAVAGRDRDRLLKLIKDVSAKVNKDLSNIGLIIADVYNEDSLISMALRSKVILNACGPYIKYGEPVVNACIKAKTHMVDISGEPQYIEGMMVKHHEEAKNAGVYIVSACGWDSIPSEIGLNFLKDKFGPNLMNSAEGFISSKIGKTGTSVNHGTLDSIAEMVAHISEIPDLRRRLFSSFFKKPRPVSKYPLKKRYIPWKNPGLGWCLPFVSENIGLADISCAWSHEVDGEPFVEYFEYMTLPRLWMSIFVLIGMVYLIFMCFFSWTRNLLTKFPKIFTLGFFSQDGPSEKALEETSFSLTMIGKGWNASNQTGVKDFPPNKTLTCLVLGPDPGYETTSRCMIQAALSIIDESDKMPFTGGVLSPGFAFRRTTIRERLNQHAVTFEIIE